MADMASLTASAVPGVAAGSGAGVAARTGQFAGSISAAITRSRVLESIWRLIAQHSEKAAKNAKSMSQGSTGTGGVGSGGSAGLGLAGFSSPLPGALSRGGMALEGGAMVGMGLLKGANAAAAFGYGMLPSTQDVYSRNRLVFNASLGASMPASQLGRMVSSMNNGRMLGSTDPYLTAAALSMRGYGMGSGYGREAFNTAANLGVLTGQSAPSVAGTLSSQMMNPAMGNRMQMLGINNVDLKTGNPIGYQKMMDQLFTKLGFGQFRTVEQFNKELVAGRGMANLSYYVPDPEMRDMTITYFQSKLKGGKPFNLGGKDASGITRLGGDTLNMESAMRKLAGSETQKIEEFGKAISDGATAAANLAKAMNDLTLKYSGMLQPLGQMRGFLEQFMGTSGGQAGLAGATLALDGLKSTASGLLLLLGGGAAMKGVGGLVSKILGVGSKTAQTASKIPFGFSPAGTAATATRASKILPFLGKLGGKASGVLTGALAAIEVGYNATQAWRNEGPSGALKYGGQALSVFSTPGMIAQYPQMWEHGLRSAQGKSGLDWLLAFSEGFNPLRYRDEDAPKKGAGGARKSASTKTVGSSSGQQLRDAGSAAAWAAGQAVNPDKSYGGLCDHFVARSYGLAHSGYETARVHMNAVIQAGLMHEGDDRPPVGASVFWDSGSTGHIAIVTGYDSSGPLVASNDVRRAGKIDVVPLKEVTKWLGGGYKGWSPPYYQGKVGSVGSVGQSARSGTSSAAGTTGMTSGPTLPSTGFLVTTSGVSFSGAAVEGLARSKTVVETLNGTAPSDSTSPKSQKSGTKSPAGGGSKVDAAGTLASGSGPEWLAQFLYGKGLRGETLQRIWAIGMRESSGRPTIDNAGLNRNKSIDYGLFQINSIHEPWLKKTFGWTMEDMRDPNKAFRAMWRMTQHGENLRSWNIGPDAYDPANSSRHTDAWHKWMADFPKYAHSASLPGYSSGAWKINRDHVAWVHKDEMVVPASVAKAVRESGQGAMSSAPGKVEIHVHVKGTDDDAVRFARQVRQVLAGERNAQSIVGT